MFEHGKKIGTSSFKSPKYFDKIFKDRNSHKKYWKYQATNSWYCILRMGNSATILK